MAVKTIKHNKESTILTDSGLSEIITWEVGVT